MSKKRFFILFAFEILYKIARVFGFTPYHLPFNALQTKPYINFGHKIQFVLFVCIHTLLSLQYKNYLSNETSVASTTFECIIYGWLVFVIGFIIFCMLFFKKWWQIYTEIAEKEIKVCEYRI